MRIRRVSVYCASSRQSDSVYFDVANRLGRVLRQAITWKRLGLYVNPIVLVNVRGFFNPCIELLESCIREKFMDLRHRSMWMVVDQPEEVLEAISKSPRWQSNARDFAAV